MTIRPIIPRAQARRDVEDIIDGYLSDGESAAAQGFVDSLQAAFGHLSRHPGSGSPRYGQELGIPGLRCWALNRYPHQIFYIEQDDHIDVWRVLHGRRDIPASLQDPTS